MENFSSYLFVTAGGIGDQILGFQCAKALTLVLEDKRIIDAELLCCARDEVYKPLKHLFDVGLFNVSQHPDKEKWAEDDWIIKNQDVFHKFTKEIDDFEDAFFVVPDHLFRSPLSFDYKKYKLSLQNIKSLRLLTHQYKPTETDVYVGIVSNTEGYLYYDIPNLLSSLGKSMPDKVFHFPILKSWANKNIYLGDFNINLPDNIIFYENPDIIEQIELMKRCCYGLYADNGMSHIAYQLGQPRVLLDPRWDNDLGRSAAWWARWREDLTDSISIKKKPDDIASLVRTNIDIPETMLLPRDVVFKNPHVNWAKEMFFKY